MGKKSDEKNTSEDQQYKSKDLLKEVEESVEKGEHLKKTVNVILNKTQDQFSIKIPKKIANFAGIKEGDQFKFHMIPKDGKFEVEAKLIKNA